MSTRMRLGLVLLLVAATGSPAAALPAAAQSQAQSPRYAAALALARELRDEQSVLTEASYVFRTETIAALAQNPELAELEKQHPGMLKHMFDAARPELERQLVASLPKLWSALADLYSAEMTEAEMAEAMAYYSSPAGRRFKAAMLRNYDYSKEIAPLVEDLNAGPAPSAIREGIQAGVPGTLAELGAADKDALMAFARTAGFAKVRKLGPRVLEVTAAWGDRSDPANEERISKIMGEAMDRFIAAKEAAK